MSLQDLPSEMVEHIITFLSVRDVVFLGETCRYLHQVCNSRRTWRSLYLQNRPFVRETLDWRRMTILNHTKRMFFHHFASCKQINCKPTLPRSPNGFQRFLAMADNLCILDYTGSLFYIHGGINHPSFSYNFRQWKTYLPLLPLCRDVKDFSRDLRSHFKCLYVLASREVRDANQDSRQCDCIEIYHFLSGHRLCRLTFHEAHLSMKFKKLVLLGVPTDRQLLLLTEEGKVYSGTFNELSLVRLRSSATQLTLRKMSIIHPSMPVTQMISNQSSVLYVTDDGTAHLEVHSSAVYKNLFGTFHGFNSLNTEVPLAVPMHSKVVLCSLGYKHLALVDKFGRIFTQGNNRFGQLGTGDVIDRKVPCEIPYLRNPTDICCNLNHTLALVSPKESVKEIHGCGCGYRGRLPGWPRGSPSFVKLILEVPMCACRIASTQNCLFIMSSYDIVEDALYCKIPDSSCDDPGSGDEDVELAQASEECL